MKKRLASVLLAMLTTIGLVVAAVPANAAPAGNTVGDKKLAMTGSVNGAPATGTFRPDHAVRNGNGVDLVGRLQLKSAKGNLNQGNVAIPLVLPTPAATPSVAAPAAVTPQAVCQVLNLVLGPLHLNLLGLHIDLNQVVLNITADPNGGILGSLLCSLAGGPTGGALSGLLRPAHRDPQPDSRPARRLTDLFQPAAGLRMIGAPLRPFGTASRRVPFGGGRRLLRSRGRCEHGRMSFAGFPEEMLTFYEGLEADNSKPYWNDHREQYETTVATPMRALLDELGPEFGEAKFFRPYRDVRFSKDKTPYKTHAGAVVHGYPGDGALYVQVSADGLLVAGGYYATATDQAQRLRLAVADDRTGRNSNACSHLSCPQAGPSAGTG